MSKWKPDRNTKVVMYFDLKRGCWLVDVKTIKLALKKGLSVSNLKYGASVLREAYAVAKQELSEEIKS